MVRKIAVILFVAFLDIAFIIAIRSDLQLGEPVEVSQVPPVQFRPFEPPPTNAVDQQSAEEAAVSDDTPVPEEEVRSAPARQRSALPRQVSPRASVIKQPAFNPEAANAIDNGFKDTIIWYKKASYMKPQEIAIAPELPRENAVAPIARMVPPKRKRSFISKAGSVVTKPYDWLKDLVSEFR